MKATVERLDNNRVRVDIEVEVERFRAAVEQAYRRIAQQVNVPGFRRGKAPRSVVERRVGRQALYEEALELLIPGVFAEAVEQTEIRPVDDPRIEVQQIGEDVPLKFSAEVWVRPEVTLGAYKGLEVEKRVARVTDERVEQALQELRESQAELVPAPHDTVEPGDWVSIDFEGFVEGRPFQGGARKGYRMPVGQDVLVPGFDEQLLGAKAGERREVRVTFPANVSREDLAGKPAVFQVTVREILMRQLPELNDAFASARGYETLEALRAEIRRRLEEAAREEANHQLRHEVVHQAAANAQVEIPPVLVDREVERMARELAEDLARRGLTLEAYLQATQRTPESFLAELRPTAEESVREALVLDEIAKQEGLEPTPEEVQERIESLVASQPQELQDRARQYLQDEDRRAQLAVEMARQRAIDLLVREAKVREVEVDPPAAGEAGEPAEATKAVGEGGQG